MTNERQNLITSLRTRLGNHPTWGALLSDSQISGRSLHLAILREPYLRFILEGKKTIETRFAKRACAPYKRVSDGDVILLKRVGGNIIGACVVEKVWFYQQKHH